MSFAILFLLTLSNFACVKLQKWDLSSADLSKSMWMDEFNRTITIARPGGNYSIVVPPIVNPSRPYPVSVNILNSSKVLNHTIKAELMNEKQVVGQKEIQNVRGSDAQTIVLDNFQNFTCQDFPVLRVQAISSSGKKVFDVQKSLKCAQTKVSLIVQTEKNLYVSDNTVHYRVVVVTSDQTAYNGAIDLQVIDPKQKVVAQVVGQKLKEGVCSGKVELGKSPAVGLWQIIVTLEKNDKVLNSGKKFFSEFVVYSKNEMPEVLTFDKYFSVNRQTSQNAVEISPKKVV